MSEQKNKLKNRLILCTVLIAFFAPLIIAWWYLNFTDVVESGAKSNYGDLILPARPLPDFALTDPLSASRKGQLHGKWSLFYISNTGCNTACEENLYRMRQLRLTTGKDDHRVQRVLLVLHGLDDVNPVVFESYSGQWLLTIDSKEQDIFLAKFKLSEEDRPEKSRRLYLVDPNGNLMMSYPFDSEPRGIIQDLKKLLKHSKIG